MHHKSGYLLCACSILFMACGPEANSQQTAHTIKTGTQEITLPAPGKSHIKLSKVIDWPEGMTPAAPEGFVVTKFAKDIKSPRNMFIGANGDVFVALANSERSVKQKIVGAVVGLNKSEVQGKSANQVLLYRDENKDGIPEKSFLFLDGLNQPFGMLIIGNWFYVANTDGLWRYPYRVGDTAIVSAGTKILELPAGGYNNHWTRNLLANRAKTKIYITVGSGSNVAEHGMDNEIRRANILEINPDGSGERIYAAGLRNPVGMDWAPGTNTLWTAVNERDNLGDDLVPDYMTSVRDGGFYGWPFAYFGPHEDPRRKGENPELVAKTIIPDVPLGSHTASLGLAFYTGNKFPRQYQGGAFIGQHGSWNRSELAGYRVAFVPFKNGKAAGAPRDFLSGFIANADKGEVYGRPVGVVQTTDGALLVADDVSGIIWCVRAK
jgi:glucose/arabinose dehydrogenase